MDTLPEIAAAPVSFGIFGGAAATDVEPSDVVSAVAEAGYRAMELGPPGLFGSPAQTAQLLARFDVKAIGAYVPLHLTADEQTYASDLASLRVTIDELVACGTEGAVAILADEGTEVLRRRPGRPSGDPLSLTDAEWELASARIERAAAMATSAGLESSFHLHLTTYVENQADLDELVARTPIPLTVDSGHFLLGGIDPVDALTVYSDRVNHIHVKDVRLGAVPSTEVANNIDVDDWWGDISVSLGEGDVDLAGFLSAIGTLRSVRWIVIEHDRDPVWRKDLKAVTAGARIDRRWLEAVLHGPNDGDGDPDSP